MRRGIALVVAGLMLTALAAAPAAHAKKAKKISGTVFVSVPGFDQTSHLSTSTGVITAKKGCQANRTVHYAFFNADGTPVNVGQPVSVSGPTGSFIVPLAEPPRPPQADDSVPYTFIVRVAVDALTIKKKGKKVNCLPITGTDQLVQVPARPQF